MFQIPLINSVRILEKRIEVEKQQSNHSQKWSQQPEQKFYLTGAKPAPNGEPKMVHTSLINAVQLWQRRWQAEEEQRNHRVRVAETGHETIFRRLPRLKLGSAKEYQETAEFCSCCQAQMGYQDCLHS